MRWAPMKGPDSRSSEELFLEKNTLIEASLASLWYRVSSRSPQPYAAWFRLREDEPWMVNVCIHLMASVCFSPGRLCPTCQLEAAFLTGSREAAALCLCERLKQKRLFHGLSPLWIEIYVPLNSFANELEPLEFFPGFPGGVTHTHR